MFLFWIICALMILLALWFVLPPLFAGGESKSDEARAANVLIYQDQNHELETDLFNGLIGEQEYQEEKEELERRLLADIETAKGASASSITSTSPAIKKVAYALAAAIPIVSVAFYLVRGNPRALNPEAAPSTMPAAASQSGEMSPQQIQANVDKLAKRLEENPNDVQGWTMLARSYAMMEKYLDAANAYARATALSGNDANLWADYAEAQAMSNDKRLDGKPMEALNKALQLDPKNEKALALAGEAAFQAADYKNAIEYWQKLPPGSEYQADVAEQLTKAKKLATGQGSR
jgi:cytochrome c-type biogenesis protein CcmH